MGIAAYNRGSQAIADQIARDYSNPVAFQIMDRINALPKIKPDCKYRQGAPKPFAPVVIQQDTSTGVWWLMDAEKVGDGFSYWYESLEACVVRWDIYLTGYDEYTDIWETI